VTPSERRMPIEDVLGACLDQLQQITSLLGLEVGDHGSDRVSSIGIEDMAKGDPKITSKMYAGSFITREEVDQALDIHAYAHREAAKRATQQWADTLDMVSHARNYGCEKIIDSPGSWHWLHTVACLEGPEGEGPIIDFNVGTVQRS
jgi:hypothetical protein